MNPKPNIALRLASMLLDHIIMCFTVVPPIIIGSFFFTDKESAAAWGPYIQLFLFFLLVLYFLKDSFNGRSIAKRITKLQVINNTTGEVASVAKCFIRNIFIIIWPVEVVVSLFSPQRRIGDFVAGTKVKMYAAPVHEKPEEF